MFINFYKKYDGFNLKHKKIIVWQLFLAALYSGIKKIQT